SSFLNPPNPWTQSISQGYHQGILIRLDFGSISAGRSKKNPQVSVSLKYVHPQGLIGVETSPFAIRGQCRTGLDAAIVIRETQSRSSTVTPLLDRLDFCFGERRGLNLALSNAAGLDYEAGFNSSQALNPVQSGVQDGGSDTGARTPCS